MAITSGPIVVAILLSRSAAPEPIGDSVQRDGHGIRIYRSLDGGITVAVCDLESGFSQVLVAQPVVRIKRLKAIAVLDHQRSKLTRLQ